MFVFLLSEIFIKYIHFFTFSFTYQIFKVIPELIMDNSPFPYEKEFDAALNFICLSWKVIVSSEPIKELDVKPSTEKHSPNKVIFKEWSVFLLILLFSVLGSGGTRFRFAWRLKDRLQISPLLLRNLSELTDLYFPWNNYKTSSFLMISSTKCGG